MDGMVKVVVFYQRFVLNCHVEEKEKQTGSAVRVRCSLDGVLLLLRTEDISSGNNVDVGNCYDKPAY